MTNDPVFISYSRRDSEFVTRLAADLDRQVAGVWFDQSDILPGQKWREQLMDGIRQCKALVLVVSPDAVKSQYVREEVGLAQSLGKTIIPILYRRARTAGSLAELLVETQFIDLRQGSYVDNFQKLVDALVDAGAVRQAGERPFLRTPAPIDWRAVFTKLPAWGAAWSLGWAVYWLIWFLIPVAAGTLTGTLYPNLQTLGALTAFTLSGALGGLTGGLLAGLVSMLALRRYAPSISWKHIAPAIRIWMLSGPLGVILAGVGTVVLMGEGLVNAPNAGEVCRGLGAADCLQALYPSTTLEFAAGIIIALLLAILAILFATGLFAGWLDVRHIRRLEPGIRVAEARWVMFGWGIGSVIGALAGGLSAAALSLIFGV